MTKNDPDDDGGKPADRLPQLAEKLNRHHKLAEEAEITAIQHAWYAGDALQEAKELVGHGGFMKWVKANFDGHHSKATRYKQIRSNYADPHNLPALSETAALKIISGSTDDVSLEHHGHCGDLRAGSGPHLHHLSANFRRSR